MGNKDLEVCHKEIQKIYIAGFNRVKKKDPDTNP
jgi:hypothetical protein